MFSNRSAVVIIFLAILAFLIPGLSRNRNKEISVEDIIQYGLIRDEVVGSNWANGRVM